MLSTSNFDNSDINISFMVAVIYVDDDGDGILL